MQDAMEQMVANIKLSIASAASSSKRYAITTPGGSSRAVPKMPGNMTPPPGSASASVPTVDLMESLMEAGFRSAVTGMAGILDLTVKQQQQAIEKQQADNKRCYELATAQI